MGEFEPLEGSLCSRSIDKKYYLSSFILVFSIFLLTQVSEIITLGIIATVHGTSKCYFESRFSRRENDISRRVSDHHVSKAIETAINTIRESSVAQILECQNEAVRKTEEELEILTTRLEGQDSPV